MSVVCITRVIPLCVSHIILSATYRNLLWLVQMIMYMKQGWLKWAPLCLHRAHKSIIQLLNNYMQLSRKKLSITFCD